MNMSPHLSRLWTTALGLGVLLRGLSVSRAPWGNMCEFSMTSAFAISLAFTLISTGPQIVAVSTPATRVYRTGGLLDVVVTFARPVTVFLPNGGRPTIDITIGSRTVRAVSVAGSGGTHLRFRYRVTADDATPPDSGILLDGTIQIPAGSLIRDLAGNDAILAFGRPDTSGVRVNPVA